MPRSMYGLPGKKPPYFGSSHESVIELRLKTRNEEVALTLDGQVGLPLRAEDRVVIRKSKTTFNLVQPMSRNYFDVLRDKLRWGR